MKEKKFKKHLDISIPTCRTYREQGIRTTDKKDDKVKHRHEERKTDRNIDRKTDIKRVRQNNRAIEIQIDRATE